MTMTHYHENVPPLSASSTIAKTLATAIEALKDDGFDADAISILSPDKQATQDIAEDTGTHAGSGAATGAVAGGSWAVLAVGWSGIGALAIPGVGPFIAAGAFATALGGAAIGAGVGAIAGALMGMGVPEEHAKYYEGEAKAGKTLVTVRADGRYDDAQRILRDHGAYDVESRDASAGLTGKPVLQSDRPTAVARTSDGHAATPRGGTGRQQGAGRDRPGSDRQGCRQRAAHARGARHARGGHDRATSGRPATVGRAD